MTPFRAIAPVAVLVLAAAAGCGDDEGGRPAATVDGIEITQQDVVDELEAIRGNEAYLEQIQTRVTVLGEDEGTFDTAFVAQLLGIRIQFAIIEAELEEREVEVDDACREAASEQMVQQAGGDEVFAAFDDDYREYLVERFAQLVALQSDLAGYPCVIEDDEDVLEDYFDEHPDAFEPNYCVSIIQVATQAEADEISGQLALGADFDQLAAERSATPPTGEPECVPAGSLVSVAPAVVDLQEGGISAPVLIQDLLFIFRLDEIQEPTFETSRDAVIGAIGQEIDATFNEWFALAVAEAEVEVDPRYGTWNADGANGPGIERPTDAATSTTAAVPTDED